MIRRWLLRKQVPESAEIEVVSAASDDCAAVARALGEVRQRMVERIREVNGTTERETIGAGKCLTDIVDVAGQHAASISRELATVEGGGGMSNSSGLLAKIADQSKMLRDHVEDMTSRVAAQDEQARKAQAESGSILAAADIIAKLGREAKSLALNARIEASRLEGQAGGFGVIAAEMQRMADQVAVANTRVQELASRLGQMLPAIAEQVRDIKSQLEGFAVASTQKVDEVEAGVAELQTSVAQIMQSNDQAIASILQSSRTALSHLQFQDVTAQGLMQIDGWLREVECDATRRGGGDAEAVAPPIHTEIGGAKDKIFAEKAGEVLLF